MFPLVILVSRLKEVSMIILFEVLRGIIHEFVSIKL